MSGRSVAPHAVEPAILRAVDALGVKLAFIEAMHIGRAVWLLGLSALLYLLPGGLLMVWLVRGLLPGSSWIERIILSSGLSVALNALLVYATLVGLRINATVVVGYLIACGLGILARWALDWRAAGRRLVTWRAFPVQAWALVGKQDAHEVLARILPAVALLATAVLVLGVRLYVVRDLAVPMWGDSYQHTMMAQLIVDNGGLFDSWEPYVPLRTFTYHFGLHANVALYHWLSTLGRQALPVYRAMIWVGQIMNVLAVLALYPLALKVSGNRWAGVAAVWLAGLFLPMPNYYVNWGRYTQLAGQVILPVAVVLSWTWFEAPSGSRGIWATLGRLVPVWMVLAGLALVHYRVLIFYGAFVASWFLVDLGRAAVRGWSAARDRAPVLWRAFWLGVGSFVLVLPWFARTLGAQIVEIVVAQLTTAPARLSSFSVQYNAIGDLATYVTPAAWLLFPVAIAVGLWRRSTSVLLVTAWWFVLFVGTNPQMLHLPGSGVITNFALFIAAYIPVSVLLGDLLGWLVARVGRRAWVHILLTVLVIGGGLHWATVRSGDLHVQQHALALQPDVEAMAWIRENTPADAQFLVNSFFAYGGSVIVGSDGGWWIPLLAGRKNTVPPLNYSAEKGPWPDYRLWVNELTQLIEARGVDDPETVRELRDRGITHVYVGQQQGRVNYGGPHVLSPDVLRDSPYYRPIYHQDQVWVFELVGQ